MPYTLGITIDGTGVTDDDAKIIGLSIMGLEYSEIADVTFINLRCIHNKVSLLYGILCTRKTIAALIVLGKLYGFDHYCYVNGKDILDAAERQRLHKINPRLLRENKHLDIVITPR